MGKCSICGQEFAGWVEEQHLTGVSTRDIAAGLKEKFGVSCSHAAVANHIAHHLSEREKDLIVEVKRLEKRLKTVETLTLRTIPAERVLFYNIVENAAGRHEQGIRERDILADLLNISESDKAEVAKTRKEVLRTFRVRHFGSGKKNE